MDPQSDGVVSGALAAVLRVSRCAGLAPLSFVKERNGWRVRLAPRLYYYGYFLITAINMATITILIRFYSYIMGDKLYIHVKLNTQHDIVRIGDVGFMTLISSVAIWKSRGHTKSMIACLNYLQKIHNEIIYQPQCDERKKLILVEATMTSVALMTALYYVSTAMTGDDKVLPLGVTSALCFASYWIQQLQVLQFMMIALHVLYTFQIINESLRNLLKDEIITIQEGPECLRLLALAYTAVCDVIREVDSCYGLILLLILSFCFYHLVITPYYLIEHLNGITNIISASDIVYSVSSIIWCLFHTTTLIMIIEPCHMTHMEMKTTRVLVSQLMRCMDSEYQPLAVELKLFYRHLVLNQLSYSPLGMFSLTRTLVATVFGSIITYLVLLVQI